MVDFKCLVAIIERSIDVIREEMKAGQEKFIAQRDVNQEVMEAIQEELRASQERMAAAINSIHRNWRRP
jgi:FixJ family two-component response regulator